MDELKKKGVTYWISLIKSAYYHREFSTKYTGNSWYSSYLDRMVKNHIDEKKDFDAKQIKEFLMWVLTTEGEIWFAQKSPSNASKLAIRYRQRLSKESEKIVVEKAKDRGSLLEYCSTFGIILPNMEKVTLKAAFNDDSTYERDYIRHIEETKSQLKGFLSQLVDINQIDQNQTVKELLETL